MRVLAAGFLLFVLLGCGEEKRDEKPKVSKVQVAGESEKDGLTRVESVTGQVEYRRENGDWKALRRGRRLKKSDEVLTGSRSLAVLVIAEGARLQLKENSHLILSQVEPWDGAGEGQEVGLTVGNLAFDVKKLTSKSKGFRFRTSTALAAIRGTKGGIGTSDKATYAWLEEGSLELQHPDRKESVMIRGGEVALQDSSGFAVEKSDSREDLEKKKSNAREKTFDPKRKSSVKKPTFPKSFEGVLKHLQELSLQVDEQGRLKKSLKKTLERETGVLKQLDKAKTRITKLKKKGKNTLNKAKKKALKKVDKLKKTGKKQFNKLKSNAKSKTKKSVNKLKKKTTDKLKNQGKNLKKKFGL